MQNLILKIAEMAQEQGMVKFESTSVFGRAAQMAVAMGAVTFYNEENGHIVVAANQ
jgi:hypothetical protein